MPESLSVLALVQHAALHVRVKQITEKETLCHTYMYICEAQDHVRCTRPHFWGSPSSAMAADCT